MSNTPTQSFDITKDGGAAFRVTSDVTSGKNYTYGLLWYLVSAPFIRYPLKSTLAVALSGATGQYDGYSPGGWTDCLEQAFAREELHAAAGAVTPAGMAAREAWFESLSVAHHFDVVPTASYRRQRSGWPLRLIPQNDYVNLYLYGPLPSLKFHRNRDRFGNCLLEDRLTPGGPPLLWSWRDSEGNRLEPVTSGWTRD